MRAVGWLCLLMLSLCVQGQVASDDEASRVLALENAWNQAEVNGDARALAQLLAPSFVYTDYDGSLMDRSAFLAHVGRRDDHYQQLGNEEQTVHLNANVIIVTGIYREKVTVNGKSVVRRGRFTDTWIKDLRAWVCAASQATMMAR